MNWNKNAQREFVGEALGTFILVLLGCGSVAVTVLFGAHQGLFQVAMVWGVAVLLAIYATRHLSCAHLNPAVSLAMAAAGRMSWKRVPRYVTAQFLGALLGAIVLYALFGNSITSFELANGIVRGTPESVRTAMIFGEFYPNPGVATIARVSMANAFFVEALGTFLLVLFIFALTEGCNVGRPHQDLAPVFIGLAVASLISLLAPLTQAGFNPARDLSPRIFAWIAGWKDAAFPDQRGGFLLVYVAGPITGAVVAALFFTKFLEPLMGKSPTQCDI